MGRLPKVHTTQAADSSRSRGEDAESTRRNEEIDMTDQIIELAKQAMLETWKHFGEDTPSKAELDFMHDDPETQWHIQRFAELVRNDAVDATCQDSRHVPGCVDAGMQAAPMQAQFTDDELDLFRQWYNSVQDTNGGYLVELDHALFRKLRAIKEAPVQEPASASPTAGMNIAQRILHVGGRNNAAGYIEFGSIQAVEALVRQVLRDLPPADIPLLSDDEIYEMYSETRSDAEMLEFGREVEAAVRKLLIATPQPAPVQEPVYAFRRKGMDDFCTCNKARFDELASKPHLFETAIFYTAQPRKAVKLSDIEIASDASRHWSEDGVDPIAFAHAIESAVWAKNGVTE